MQTIRRGHHWSPWQRTKRPTKQPVDRPRVLLVSHRLEGIKPRVLVFLFFGASSGSTGGASTTLKLPPSSVDYGNMQPCFTKNVSRRRSGGFRWPPSSSVGQEMASPQSRVPSPRRLSCVMAVFLFISLSAHVSVDAALLFALSWVGETHRSHAESRRFDRRIETEAKTCRSSLKKQKQKQKFFAFTHHA